MFQPNTYQIERELVDTWLDARLGDEEFLARLWCYFREEPRVVPETRSRESVPPEAHLDEQVVVKALSELGAPPVESDTDDHDVEWLLAELHTRFGDVALHPSREEAAAFLAQAGGDRTVFADLFVLLEQTKRSKGIKSLRGLMKVMLSGYRGDFRELRAEASRKRVVQAKDMHAQLDDVFTKLGSKVAKLPPRTKANASRVAELAQITGSGG